MSKTEKNVVLVGQGLGKFYEVQRRGRKASTLKAVQNTDLVLERGKTLAVVGESGCGKSTLARLITMIEEPSSGSLVITGQPIEAKDKERIAKLRSKVQMVFQDPYGSLNPRQKIGHALEEPLLVNTRLSKSKRRDAAIAMMEEVGLRPEQYGRYPHMFSGGQRQRIAIARALMLHPDILVLDEPVSALDVSIQAQILNLLAQLQQRYNLAYLFISHDLSVVKHIADRVLVMYLGSPVEFADRDSLFTQPQHPYTKALLSATPVADPFLRKKRIMLKGELPSPIDPPCGCTFHPRCPEVMDICKRVSPTFKKHNYGYAACFKVEKMLKDA